MTKPTSERRAHQRVEARFQLQSCPDEGGVVARMIANNLSLGGLQCMSSSDFPEMTRLAVRLLLPAPNGDANEPVDIEAVVVRREEHAQAASGEPRFELSLFFTRIDDGDKQRLAAFISKHYKAVIDSTPAAH